MLSLLKARCRFGCRAKLVWGVGLSWLAWAGILLPFICLGSASKGLYDIWQIQEAVQQSPVTAVVQSQDGYLWLGTYHGLGRFDGLRLTLFNSSNTTNLENGLITTLYVNPDGVLWIGHETGQLTRYFDGSFQAVNLGRTWPGGAVEAITSDEHGDLWLLNDTGTLFRVRDGLSVQIPGASPTQKVALTRERGGKVWLVCAGAVAALHDGGMVKQVFPDSSADDFYERVTPARDGGLWVLGKGRLRKYADGRGWTAERRLPSPAPEAVTLMFEARSGELLLGTLRDGLYVLRGDGETLHYDRESGLSHDWIRALCDDHEGNIWLGTGSGFDGLRARKVQMLVHPGGWKGCVVRPFIVETNGSAWVGTEGAGLFHYDARADRWDNYGQSAGISNLFVWSVLKTGRDELLVGTWGGGLMARHGDAFETPSLFQDIIDPVTALFESHDGDLWVGTHVGIRRYHDEKLCWSAGAQQLALPDVRAIAEAGDGTFWFGLQGGGLASLKGTTLKQFRKTDGLASDFTVTLYADRDEGTLWIGSSDNGLTRLKDGKFAVISTAQELPNTIICHVVDDGAGNLWIGTLGGILRASKADLNRCADGLVDSVRFLSYGKAEGMSSPSCSGGFQPGACKASDGRLWFPTTKGLAIIDPANVSTNTVAPPVVLEEVLVDHIAVDPTTLASAIKVAQVPVRPPGSPSVGVNPVFVGNESGVRTPGAPDKDGSGGRRAGLRFPPERRQFEFRYTALSFMAPDKVRFRHKLEGVDPDWVEESKRSAQYSYLPPGDYVFRVTACNNDEFWNENGASLAFTKLPYFWQTWWFETLALAMGAAGVGTAVMSVMRRRVRQKLQLLERQRALERERARIARDIHDDLGASLTRISMLSQSARSEIETQPQAAADLDQIYSTSRELTRAMDEIVWAVNPKHDTLDSLVTYLGRFAQNFLSAADIRCRLDVPLHLPILALSAEVRHNVFLAFKEALHNTVKHAQATEVRVSLQLLSNGFALVVADNGCGFEWQGVKLGGTKVDSLRSAPGNGLLNMQKRLEEIDGLCEWETAPGEGTRVKFLVVVNI